MKNNLYWGFMIFLSEHMWGDEESPAPGWYLPKDYSENNRTDVATWDATVQYLGTHGYNMLLVDVGDGMKFDSHPEISAPNAWDKDFLKKKLDEARALGLTPVPKLNFSTAHNTWMKEYRRMVSSPIYYRVCADLIKEVCEAFGNPPLFHLGFDEETANGLNGEILVVRGPKLWWHDLHFLAAECEKNGSRPWIWSDYIWSHEAEFVKNMSKEIMQSNWYYGTFYVHNPNGEHPSDRYIESYELLDRLGFDQIACCSSFCNVHNSRQTVAHCKEKLSKELFKGFLVAPWIPTTPDNKHGLLCDAERFYFGRREFWPESL